MKKEYSEEFRLEAVRLAQTDSKHCLPISPNLLERNFDVTGPNQCWVGNITYIPTDEVWLYLAAELYPCLLFSVNNPLTQDATCTNMMAHGNTNHVSFGVWQLSHMTSLDRATRQSI